MVLTCLRQNIVFSIWTQDGMAQTCANTYTLREGLFPAYDNGVQAYTSGNAYVSEYNHIKVTGCIREKYYKSYNHLGLNQACFGGYNSTTS